MPVNKNSVEEYISQFPQPTQLKLNQIREFMLNLEPEIEETISYGMPAYKWKKKPIVYYAAYSNHIGLYATPTAHTAFKSELEDYVQGKGSVQFPLKDELPMQLIQKIIYFKLKEAGFEGK